MSWICYKRIIDYYKVKTQTQKHGSKGGVNQLSGINRSTNIDYYNEIHSGLNSNSNAMMIVGLLYDFLFQLFIFVFSVAELAGKDLYVNPASHIPDASMEVASINHGNVFVTEIGEEFSVIKVRLLNFIFFN